MNKTVSRDTTGKSRLRSQIIVVPLFLILRSVQRRLQSVLQSDFGGTDRSNPNIDKILEIVLRVRGALICLKRWVTVKTCRQGQKLKTDGRNRGLKFMDSQSDRMKRQAYPILTCRTSTKLQMITSSAKGSNRNERIPFVWGCSLRIWCSVDVSSCKSARAIMCPPAEIWNVEHDKAAARDSQSPSLKARAEGGRWTSSFRSQPIPNRWIAVTWWTAKLRRRPYGSRGRGQPSVLTTENLHQERQLEKNYEDSWKRIRSHHM